MQWRITGTNNEKLFSYFDFRANSIQFYALYDEKFEREIRFESEGPNKVSVTDYIIGDSSVFVIDPPRVSEVNFRGDVLERIDYSQLIGDDILLETSNFMFDHVPNHGDQNVYPILNR